MSENPKIPKKKKEEKSLKSFSVLVRKRGKFQQIGSSTNKTEAVDLLKKEIRSSASASGKILEDGRLIDLFIQGFQQSRRERGVVIQPREQRIGSFGEKQEITYKGILASKSKGLNKSNTRRML